MLAAWESDDGDIIVWGTHDQRLARVAVKAALYDEVISLEPFEEVDAEYM